MRVANVYDIDAKTYLIKLQRSGGGSETGESEKVLLLMESAVRFHATRFARDKSTIPSNFTMKLRKHLRSRRLESITQLGMDRVIDFQFGSGEAAHHLILELYAKGNVILTDHEYNVMTLLRSYNDDKKEIAIMANHPYPLKAAAELPSEAPTRASIEKVVKDVGEEKRKLKELINRALPYGPTLIENCIIVAGLQQNQIVDASLLTDPKLDVLVEELGRMHVWVDSLVNPEQTLTPTGLVTLKPASKDDPEGTQVYSEFLPRKLAQHADSKVMEFASFDAAMDEFFSKSEEQRAELQVVAKQKQAMSKLDKIRVDQESRVTQLETASNQMEERAQLIEYNLTQVEQAMGAVNEALAAGMDWDELKALIRTERKAGNPVATLIHELHLERNAITLLLSNTLDDAAEEEMTAQCAKVEVDLNLSAHANAAEHYGQRKKSAAKQQKTMDSSIKVLKVAEKKAVKQAAAAAGVTKINAMRKVAWFEKFDWFVTSENFLVLCGRDKVQSDLIIRRYMAPGDIFVGSEMHNTPCCVLKMPAGGGGESLRGGEGVPLLSVAQAGHAVICRSDAWNSKMVTSAWWVYPDQVSKNSPAGAMLPGEVHINGHKNLLLPSQLIMGYSLLVLVDDSTPRVCQFTPCALELMNPALNPPLLDTASSSW
jgi:predicted ribosome quality control (RQC) complex YloA/Tae2 family protein